MEGITDVMGTSADYFFFVLLLLLLLYVFHLKTLVEVLGETRIIIIIQIIIISAGTPLVSNSCHLSWNPKYIEFLDQYILVSS